MTRARLRSVILSFGQRFTAARIWLPENAPPARAESGRGPSYGEEARQLGCRAPIPRPETAMIRSRAPWRKLAKYPKPRRGDTGGVGLAVSGGIAAKLREWDSGDRGGCAVHLAINHLVARRTQEVQPPRGCLSACSREVADGGNLLDQVLAGRIVPAVNGVGVVGHAGDPARLDHRRGRAERNRYFL